MNESLPLFSDGDDLPAEAPQPQASGHDQHLAAARRLARDMRRYADHSPEQRAAGQRICRHLIAMLQAAQTEPDSSQH